MTTNKPKERPILFNAEMVRAILDGRKTQTRRIIKPQPVWDTAFTGKEGLVLGENVWSPDEYANYATCPFGQTGDRLWVRETWRPSIIHSCAMDACDCDDVAVKYAADGECRPFTWHSQPAIPDDWCMPKAAVKGNVPSLFMPRWASRITLELTGVRVERLQYLSDEDARAEGAPSVSFPLTESQRSNIDRFRALWNLIHGAGAWGENPWVWAIEFKRVEP